jgi:uncharacterized protein YecE (DUF72 family)
VRLWIGTSGWQYRHWRERFYPRGLPTDRWLDRYAEAFDTVEVNVTFYRQPKPSVFEGWRQRAPEGFLFAVKASRFLTHIKRLREPADSVDRLMEGASRLGPHLGPILIQLPPDLEAEPERLAETLAAFPNEVRVTVEPRHRSWFSEDVTAILESHAAALCWADRRGPLTPERSTAPWGYVRFHGGRASPRSCYTREALEDWAARVANGWPPGSEVFAYFNNDHNGCALRDAGLFAGLGAEHGLRPTRTPKPASIAVG